MPFLRRKGRSAPPASETRTLIHDGWNGVPWGASVSEFQARFPHAAKEDSGWWATGEGPEAFCGIVMRAQYAFNDSDQLYMVSFIPEAADRGRVSVAAVNELGAPDGSAASWTIGEIEVEVKVAGVVVTMTHERLADH
jgi:hypothetical protein